MSRVRKDCQSLEPGERARTGEKNTLLKFAESLFRKRPKDPASLAGTVVASLSNIRLVPINYVSNSYLSSRYITTNARTGTGGKNTLFQK